MKNIILIFFFALIALLANKSNAQIQIQQVQTPQGWVLQNSGTTNGLRSVFFSSTDTGWIAAGGGFVLRTTDAGLHWIQHSVPDPLGVSSIVAVDGKTAWCTDDQSRGNMFFTNDGGQTWTQQIPNSGNEGLVSLAFPTKDIGYGLGDHGVLIKTTNGGQTWTQHSIDMGSNYFGSFHAMHYIDSKNGLLAADGAVIRTLINGTGYVIQKDSSFGNAVLYACNLATPSREFAVGAEQISNGSPVIVRSIDGGKTWSRAQLPIEVQKNTLFMGITFTDSLHGMVVGDNGTILRTTDGGDTWMSQASGVIGDLNSVSFTDSLTGTIVGAPGIILRTVNGGVSWVQPISPTDTLLTQTYPDPANRSINFQYTLPIAESVTISVLDAAGHSVGILLNNAYQSEGVHTIPINTSLYGTGMYYYQLRTNHYFSTGKFIKMGFQRKSFCHYSVLV
jgi:photosystem II stability/assembly factor-like uncharacterized protein